MDTLILFTRHYPYDCGEEFIENEITFLSKSFDRVIIAATSVSKKSNTREIPPNIELIPLSDTQITYIRYLKYVVKSFFIKSEIKKNELEKHRKIVKRMSVRYAFARAFSNVKRIKKNVYCTVSNDCNLYFYSYWFGDLALTAVMLADEISLGKKAVISRAHGYDLYEDRNPSGVIPFANYILNKIDCVYPCSNAGREYILSHWIIDEKKVETAYLGTKEYVSTNIANRREPFVIATCSSITSVKRVMLVAEALRTLQLNRRIKWICIGDGPLLNHIIDYSEKNLQNVDIEFKGRLQNSEVLRLYATNSISLFINTSSSEGLPVSIMEAASFGIPAIATDVGGTREIVISGKNGFLLSQNPSPEEIATEIERVVHMNDEEYHKLCSNAYDHWMKNFNCNTNYPNLIKVIKKFILEK